LLSYENQPIDLILMATNKLQAIKFNHTHLLGIQYLSIPEVNLILDESLALSYQFLEVENAQVRDLKSYFISELTNHIPGIKFNGACSDSEISTYTLVNICLPVSATSAPMFLFQLDLKGIACSKGSACQSGSGKGSHVLAEILKEEDMKRPSIRFSLSIYNTKKEVQSVVSILKELVNEANS